MSASMPIKYTGGLPSGSLTTVLFDSTTRRYKGGLQRLGYPHYGLSLANSHFGTLNGYGSPDGGLTWHQFVTHRMPPNAPRTLHPFSCRVDQHPDVKFEWVNGGTLQTTFYPAQMLCREKPELHIGYGDSTYIVGQSMAHAVTFRGPAIQIGPKGELEMAIQWAATGTPVGTLALQFLKDGSNWRNIPDAELAFSTQVAGIAGDIVCGWSGLNTYTQAALLYTSASGGAANSSLAAQFCTR